MHELAADKPGDYLLSHTPDGLVVLMRRDGDDVEVIDVVVPLGVGADRAHHQKAHAAQQA